MITEQEVKAKVPKLLYDKINFRTINECWEWNSSLTRKGYGQFNTKINGVKLGNGAHRMMYKLLFDPNISSSIYVLHRCDNRKCCNPNHLFLGSLQDNNADRHNKGRTACGIKIKTSKLTNEKVLEIRDKLNKGEKVSQIALDYKLSTANIYAIKFRRTWKNI